MREEGATKTQKFQQDLKWDEGVSEGCRLNLHLGNIRKTLPSSCVMSDQNEK